LNVLGVDFNSAAVTNWQKQGYRSVYGDAEDPEYPGTLPLNQAQWVLSTIPQLDVNLALLDALHHYGYSGKKAATAHRSVDAEILKESGADVILSPFADAAKEAADLMIGEGSSGNQ
jgi:Trk K+ transport system NAD-binding subunit